MSVHIMLTNGEIFCNLSLVFRVEEADLVTLPLLPAALNTHEAIHERDRKAVWVTPAPSI